jgi:hypothetical protein
MALALVPLSLLVRLALGALHSAELRSVVIMSFNRPRLVTAAVLEPLSRLARLVLAVVPLVPLYTAATVL